MTLLAGMAQLAVSAQPDTVKFYSKAFDAYREAYVHTVGNARYAADSLRWPVIYVLDGQHDWFTEPVVNDIQYLQRAYELPEAIIVVVPHEDRNEECAIRDLEGEPLPLHRLLTEELNPALEPYRPGAHRILIGHSYSASFALYSLQKSDGFFSGVVAHTPLDRLDDLVGALAESTTIDPAQIAISVGSPAFDKDRYHREAFEAAKAANPDFFEAIITYEADHATHNAVPIVANAACLNRLYGHFSRRYVHIARVDANYKLMEEPGDVATEMGLLVAHSRLGHHYCAPRIAELNGLASRYLNSGFNDHAKAVYQMGIERYPKYFDFYLNLYNLNMPENPGAAKAHLEQGRSLFVEYESAGAGFQDYLEEIDAEMRANGW